MTESTPKNENSPPRGKRWETPRILSRETIEAVAAVCSPGKASPLVAACANTVISS